MELKNILHPPSVLTPNKGAAALHDQSADCWERLRKGDQEAFSRIYYEYIDDLYHYGERLTSDRPLIEDCLQDLFAELWSRQERLPEVKMVKFYLFKALKRKIVKKLVKQQKFSSDDPLSHDFEITFAPEVILVEEQLSPEQQAQILQAINQLSPRQKELITLRFYDNFQYEEIAEIMSLSIRSVYNLLYRALAVLRRSLASSLYGWWLLMLPLSVL